MAEPAHRVATYEDLVALPDNVVGEIVGGELYASPRPALRHAHAASGLGVLVGGPFGFDGGGGPGGWLILHQPELHFGRDVLVPDLAGWRRARAPKIAEDVHTSIAPDWVCGVLSPSTARLDRVRKLPVYAREGVGNAWLIDATARTLEVYRLRDGLWTLVATHADAELVRAEPFEAVELPLSRLWDVPL